MTHQPFSTDADSPPTAQAHGDATTPRASRKALVIGMIVVSLGLVALCLGLTEVAFRLMRPGPRVGSLVLDQELGWDRFPQTDPQIAATAPTPQPPLRVLCIGDSFTHNTAWSRMLIEELNRRGIAVTGWEAGVSGYGQVQEAMKLEKLLPELKPDLTVLLFYAWNDPRDNCAAPAIVYNPDMLGRPFMRPDGSIDDTWMRGMTVRDSELYRRLLEAPLFRRSLKQSSRAMREGGVDAIAAEDQRLLTIYSEPATWMPLYMRSAQNGPYLSLAWRDTERALRRIAELCAAGKSELIVVGIDAPFTIDRDVFEKHVVTDPRYNADDVDLALPLSRFSSLAQSLGLREVTVATALAEFARVKGGKIYDGEPGNLTGHLLREPQEVMARLIADAVEARWKETHRLP